MFENNAQIHVYSLAGGPRAQADNPPAVIFFSISVLFSQYSPVLQVFPIK